MMKLKILLLVLLTLCIRISLLYGEIIGNFGELKGEVWIKRKGASESGKVRKGFTLGEGDIIITGEVGMAEMVFNTKDRIRLGRNSSVKLLHAVSTSKGIFPGRVLLEKGEMLVSLKDKRNGEPLLEIETPHGIVFGRKGSTIFIKTTDGTTKVYCIRGSAIVKDKTEEKKLLLEAGFMSELSINEFPLIPEKANPAEISTVEEKVSD